MRCNKTFIVSMAVLMMVGSAGLAAAQTPAGEWDFNTSGTVLTATTGSDLTLTGSQTWIAGIGDTGGATRIGVGSYFTCTHGIAANGGGTKVNNYSLLIDFRVPDIAAWRCFYQADPTNASDGEIFVRGSATFGTIGVGTVGYSTTAVTPNTWNRLIIVINLNSAASCSVEFYLNGTQIHTTGSYPAGTLVDDRFSLDPTMLLFADNDSEDGQIDVSKVAIYNTALTSGQAAALGSAVEVAPPAALAISKDPVGSTIELGGSHVFSVTAAGGTAPYSYQWKRDVTNVGTDSNALTISPAAYIDGGAYTCTVTDSAVSPASVTSSPATLNVVAPGSLPVAGLAALLALAGATALGGVQLVRRMKRG